MCDPPPPSPITPTRKFANIWSAFLPRKLCRSYLSCDLCDFLKRRRHHFGVCGVNLYAEARVNGEPTITMSHSVSPSLSAEINADIQAESLVKIPQPETCAR